MFHVGEITQGSCIIDTLVLPSLNRILCFCDCFVICCRGDSQEEESVLNSRSPPMKPKPVDFMKLALLTILSILIKWGPTVHVIISYGVGDPLYVYI